MADSEYMVVHTYKPAHRVSVTQLRATTKEEAEKQFMQRVRGAEKMYNVILVRKMQKGDWE